MRGELNQMLVPDNFVTKNPLRREGREGLAPLIRAQGLCLAPAISPGVRTIEAVRNCMAV